MSSSESDTSSDESVEIDATEFLKVVKTCINKSKKISTSSRANETKTQNTKVKPSPKLSKRQQLYETFTKVKPAKKTNKETESSTSNIQDLGFVIDTGKSAHYGDDLPSFCIDKKSGKDSNTEMGNDTVTEVINLSGIDIDEKTTESATEEEQEETIKPHKNKKMNRKKQMVLSSSIQTGIKEDDVYVNVSPYEITRKELAEKKSEKKEPDVMKKSVITDDYEKQDSIATTHVSKRQEKRERKKEREKTKGGKWFDMPATEMTEELKNDLSVLHMRKALDPKRFYKSNDMKALPKYFQFGTVIESKADFYHSRIPKKQRKSTMVEELLADTEFRRYNKRKYEEVQEAKRMGQGPYKHMKRLKKRKR